MVEITVSVAEYNQNMIDVPLYLITSAPLTPDNAKNPTLGQWSCTSPYLGKGYVGQYYIKNILLPTCSTKEERWTVCNRPEVINPMTFFFDTDQDKPFLVLYGFAPGGSRRGGWGEIVKSTMSTFAGVSWKTR